MGRSPFDPSRFLQSPINPQFVIKKLFFDKPKVIKIVGETMARTLNRMGGRIKITMKRSMKYAKGPSAPGTPPHAHRGKGKRPLLRTRTFHYLNPDKIKPSVIAGPELLPGKSSTKSVPRLLEKGGTLPRKKNPRRAERKIGGTGIIRVVKQGSPGAGSKFVKGRRGRKYNVVFAKIKTEKQLERVNENEEKIFGSFYINDTHLAARPYVAPAFNKVWPSFHAVWRANLKARIS